MKDFALAKKWLEGARSVLLTTHVRPDGDAVGSVMAMARGLERMSSQAGRPCDVGVVFLSPVPEVYRFLLAGWEQRIVEGHGDGASPLTEKKLEWYDRVVVLDTNTSVQLPGLGDWLRGKSSGVIVMDHHAANDGWGHCRLVDTQTAATGEIVYRFCRESGWTVDAEMATGLVTAIATDTGWFRFDNTAAGTYEAAGELVAAGARPGELYRRLFESFPAARVRLEAAVLGTLDLLDDDRTAFMTITQQTLRETRANRSLTENLVNLPMQAGSVAVSVVLIEQDDGSTRVSLRSRYGVDVNAVAKSLGGGGHTQAAGATLKMNIAAAKDKVAAAVTKALEDAGQ